MWETSLPHGVSNNLQVFLNQEPIKYTILQKYFSSFTPMITL